jgi:2'-5' RNA ligase/uncharacterized protein (UPF0248 family)
LIHQESLNLNEFNVILNPNKQEYIDEEKVKQLKINLEIILAEQLDQNQVDESFLVTFYSKAFDLAAREFEKVKKPSPKLEKKQKESKKSDKSLEEPKSKKCSMKTASDVIKRIQWDQEINKSFITVGYLDRFLGLKECSFDSFDWGDIVLADLGALAIPEHRINYFKYKNEIIWNKKNRLDNVFGSTGSNIKIQDVIERLAGVEYDAKSFEKSLNALENLDEEKCTNKLGRVSSSDEIKSQPNYFISVPINGAEIKETLFNLKCDLIDSCPEVECMLLPDTSFHITLCTLKIDDQNDLELVKDVLDVLKEDESLNKSVNSLRLKFEGVGEFYNKVFYVKTHQDSFSELNNIRKIIVEKLETCFVKLAGNYYDFVPHLTVFKVSRNSTSNFVTTKKNKFENIKIAKKEKMHELCVSQFVSQHVLKKYEQLSFGQQSVKEIELCKMVNIFDFKTYPVEHTIKFE